MKLHDLPKIIKVRIKRLPKGKFFIELIDYGIFSEADNQSEIHTILNDLIYCYFDVPKEIQNQFHYEPAKNREDIDFEKAKKFLIFSTPEFYKKYMPA